MISEKTGHTIGEMMSAAAKGSAVDICEVEHALSYAADTAAVLEAAKALGFMYDEERDIFYTRKDSLQHLFGFNSGIDYNEFLLGMNLNALPITFTDTNGTQWLLEFWSGQYGLGVATGAEVGIYKYTGEYAGKDYSDMLHYESPPMEEWMDMSFILKNAQSGEVIVERSSHDYGQYYDDVYGEYAAKDWWVAGYKLGSYNDKEDLLMEVRINLTEEQRKTMIAPLDKALRGLKSKGEIVDYEIHSNGTVEVTW